MKINIIKKMKLNILKKIILIFNKYNINKYLISFSGGIDSSVLLDIMNDIKIENKFIKIKAVHINHQLNNFSNLYSDHCIKYCNKLNINLLIKKIYINKIIKKKNGLEFSCRELRYKEISKLLDKDEILLTAHHKNDQVETFFLFLNRGSGSKGLSGIKIFNNIYSCKIFRPLLEYKKIDIINYAKNKNINYIYDISNNDNNINRNFIRNKIIPLIEYKWPNFIESVSKSMNIYLEQDKLLNIYIKNDLKIFITDKNLLDINKLINFNKNIIYINIILKFWLKLFNIIPSYKQLLIIYNEIINSKIDSNPLLKINNKYITKFKNFLYCISKQIKLNKQSIIWQKDKKILYLPNNMGFLKKDTSININNKKYIYTKVKKYEDYEIISIQFSTISYHTKIKISDLKYTKSIKKIWNLYKIPFWIRDKIPLLFYNNKLISAINVFTINNKNNNNKKNFIYIKWYNSPIKKYLKNI